MSDKIEVIDAEIVEGQLNAVVKQSDVEQDCAVALRDSFAKQHASIIEWRTKATMIDNPQDEKQQKVARQIRLNLRDARIDVEKTRKALKEESLRRGKAIDGYANILKYLAEPAEAYLLEIEQYAERKEAARISEMVADRTAKLMALEVDPAIYNLAAMDEPTFADLLDASAKKKAEREELARRMEAERIAKEKAEAEERERIRAENERLKKEAEAAEKARASELARIEAERKAEREKAEKARLEVESKLEAERKARAEEERKAQEAREKAEADAKAKASAELARIEAEKEQAENAAKAPDREKLIAYATALGAVQMPELKSKGGKAFERTLKEQREKMVAWIKEKAAGI